MKKTMVILLSMLMVLAIGQSAFAKNYVGLALGYNGSQGSYTAFADEDYDRGDFTDNGFKISLFVNSYLTDKFSLAGEVRIATLSGVENYNEYYNGEDHKDTPYDYKYTNLNFNLFGRYDVYRWNTSYVGVQAGFMNNTNFWKYDEQNEEVFAPNEYPFRNYIISFVALGAYADINVMPKLNVYTDLKFPIGFWDDFEVGFFEVFFYDIILGATYEIAPNISLGIEGNISNANYGGLEIALYEKYDKENNKDNTENKYFNFTIGAKVGYSF